jgi:hypothetical protein
MKTKKRKPLLDARLTAKEWQELKVTGCVVKGERIIRTMSFIKGRK